MLLLNFLDFFKWKEPSARRVRRHARVEKLLTPSATRPRILLAFSCTRMKYAKETPVLHPKSTILKLSVFKL